MTYYWEFRSQIILLCQFYCIQLFFKTCNFLTINWKVRILIIWIPQLRTSYCFSKRPNRPIKKLTFDCGIRTRLPKLSPFLDPAEGEGGGVLGVMFAGYVPLASQSPYPIIVYFFGKCNFHYPNLVTFYLCIYLFNVVSSGQNVMRSMRTSC